MKLKQFAEGGCSRQGAHWGCSADNAEYLASFQKRCCVPREAQDSQSVSLARGHKEGK